jgi:hypothetical protein
VKDVLNWQLAGETEYASLRADIWAAAHLESLFRAHRIAEARYNRRQAPPSHPRTLGQETVECCDEEGVDLGQHAAKTMLRISVTAKNLF